MTSTRTATKAHKRTVTSILGVAGIALAAAVSAPATAGAQGVPSAGSVSGSAEALPTLTPADNRLVATGGSPTGTCAGVVSATIDGEGYPHTSQVSWGAGVVGVGDCGLTATLSWQNLDTGETGEKSIDISEPRFATNALLLAHPKDALIPTGPGQVEYSLTTNGGAEAGPILVQTPEYED